MDPYTTAAMLILSVIEHAAAAFNKLKRDAKQNAAWTDEQAAAFDKRMADAMAGPAWQPDAKA